MLRYTPHRDGNGARYSKPTFKREEILHIGIWGAIVLGVKACALFGERRPYERVKQVLEELELPVFISNEFGKRAP